MADNHSPEKRSYNMSQIRSKDTKPETLVRKYLFKNGFRYRKNVSSLPGNPDIVLKKYKTVIFVHGCFWHMHDCGRFRWPATNEAYWKPKILGNVSRDQKNHAILQESGWNVIVIWECELKKKNIGETMDQVMKSIRENQKMDISRSEQN